MYYSLFPIEEIFHQGPFGILTVSLIGLKLKERANRRYFGLFIAIRIVKWYENIGKMLILVVFSENNKQGPILKVWNVYSNQFLVLFLFKK